MTEPTDTTTPPENELGHRRRVLQLADDIADRVHEISDLAREYSQLGVPSREWLDIVSHRFGERVRGAVTWAAPYAAPVIDVLLATAGSPADVNPVAMGAAGVIESFLRPPSQEPADRSGLTIEAPSAAELDRAAAFAEEFLRSDLMVNNPTISEVRVLATCFLALDAGAPRLTEAGHVNRTRKVLDRLFGEAPKMTDASGKVDETQAPAIEVHCLLRGAPMQFSGILSTTPEGTLKLLTPVPATRDQQACMIEQFFDYSDVVSVALVREVKASAAPSIIRPS